MYDPTIARFLTEDTLKGDKNDPLSLNLYTYCHNEPLMYTDPTGHYYVPGLHYSGQMVYGNSIDIATFKNVIGSLKSDFRYTIGTATNPIDPAAIYSDEIIVGGTGAQNGVSSDVSGAKSKIPFLPVLRGHQICCFVHKATDISHKAASIILEPFKSD